VVIRIVQDVFTDLPILPMERISSFPSSLCMVKDAMLAAARSKFNGRERYEETWLGI